MTVERRPAPWATHPGRWVAVAIASLGCLAGPVADAAEVSGNQFSFSGGSANLADAQGVVPPIGAYWNPRNPRENGPVHSPGFHVAFFGSGAGCGAGTANGPVVAVPGAAAGWLAHLGIARPASGGNGTSWSPAPDADLCPGSRDRRPGPAYVSIDAAHGLSLFTFSGPADLPYFWVPIGNDVANNAAIEGTFVTWIFDWRHGQAVHPWDGSGAPALFRSMQSVSAATVPDDPRHQSPQAKQQYAVSFLNPPCLTAVTQKRYCTVRYMFETALVRGSDTDWSQEVWSHKAILLLDPAQGGLPVIGGPLGEKGEGTPAAGPDGPDLWISGGSATAHGPIALSQFEARMRFGQFVKGLRIIAAKVAAANGDTSDDAGMARLFGPQWHDPTSWIVTDANAAQEVHNLDPTQTNLISGDIASLQIIGR